MRGRSSHDSKGGNQIVRARDKRRRQQRNDTWLRVHVRKRRSRNGHRGQGCVQEIYQGVEGLVSDSSGSRPNEADWLESKGRRGRQRPVRRRKTRSERAKRKGKILTSENSNGERREDGPLDRVHDDQSGAGQGQTDGEET